MRVLFAGTPDVALPSLDALLDSGHEVVAVLTRPDAPAGRGRALVPSPVKERALDAGVEVHTPERPADEAFVERVRELAPDACPIVAYGGLVPPELLAIPAHGWVNLHFSLLPAWRGAAPVQHAIIAGDAATGASTFLLEPGLDTGPVLGRLRTPIGPDETSGDLLARLAQDGASLLLRALDELAAGTARPRPQPREGVSLAPKLTVDDARVDFAAPADEVDRRIRGCTPAPGAWALLRGERVKLGPVTLAPEAEPLAAGRLRAGKRDVLVGTGSVPVRLGTVQARGKRPMPAADWARGLRLGDDDGFDA